MKTAKVVIGTNYGDEGKGSTTNFLAGDNSVVVRFNGGAQAGHTVIQDGKRHVFHSVGSATMKDVPTILGPKFAIDPIMFWAEINELHKDHGIEKFRISADYNCPIVFPFDVFINQAVEQKRSNNRHGSCGMGFGECVHRNTQEDYAFKLVDVDLYDIVEAYQDIKDKYFWPRVSELGITEQIKGMQKSIERLEPIFFTELRAFFSSLKIGEFSDLIEGRDLIFEGAQGLCLDQNSEDFPHVTYSNTGLDNVIELLDPEEYKLEVHYITRTYLTRHGAGLLKREYDEPLNIKDETNIPNDYQGTLRFAPLDYIRMRRDIDNDLNKAKGFKVHPKLMISCCDQIKDIYPDKDVLGHIQEITHNVGLDDYCTCWGPDGKWKPKDHMINMMIEEVINESKV